MFFSHTPKNNDKRLGFDRYNTPSLGRHALPKPGDLQPFLPRQPLPQTPVEEPRKMLSEAERAAILAVPDKRGSLYVSVWAPHANEAGEELPPVQGRHFLDALQLVATCHRKQGRLDSAEASLQRILEIKQTLCAERPEAPPHSELADTLNDLGLVHLKQGGRRLGDAEAAFAQALAIRTDPRLTAFQRKYHAPHPAPPDPDVAIAHNNLALVRLKQRRLDEAEAGFRAALDLQKNEGEVYLGAPLELGNLTHNLATCHQMQGRKQLAEEGFQIAALCFEAARAQAREEDERIARFRG